MRDHSWALAAWEIERLKGNIKEKSLLLHVDYHLDDVPDGLFVDGILTAQNKEEIISLFRTREELESGTDLDKSKIYIDNFIWPAFVRGTLGEMFIISQQQQLDFSSWILDEQSNTDDRFDNIHEKEQFLKLIGVETFKRVHRVHSLREFKQQAQNTFIDNLCHVDSRILNLDLDYFNNSGNLLHQK